MLVDASNEGYEVCLRREKEAEEKGILFLTMGLLGSDKEVQKQCGFIVSGSREGYDLIENHLKKAATEVDYEPCVAYIGASVSASYCTMVLSGLCLSLEQLLAEAYHMLAEAGFTNEEASKSLSGWNKDDLESPLLESLIQVLKKKDQDVEGCEKGEGSLLDKVVDCPLPLPDDAVLLREGVEHHVAIDGLSSAVNEIYVSVRREQRTTGTSCSRLRCSCHASQRPRVRLAEAGPRAADRGSPQHVRVRTAGADGAGVRAAAPSVERLQLVGEDRGGGACDGGQRVVPIGAAESVEQERW